MTASAMSTALSAAPRRSWLGVGVGVGVGFGLGLGFGFGFGFGLGYQVAHDEHVEAVLAEDVIDAEAADL